MSCSDGSSSQAVSLTLIYGDDKTAMRKGAIRKCSPSAKLASPTAKIISEMECGGWSRSWLRLCPKLTGWPGQPGVAQVLVPTG